MMSSLSKFSPERKPSIAISCSMFVKNALIPIADEVINAPIKAVIPHPTYPINRLPSGPTNMFYVLIF